MSYPGAVWQKGRPCILLSDSLWPCSTFYFELTWISIKFTESVPFLVLPFSSSMALLLPWTLVPQQVPTSPHKRSRRSLRSIPTCLAPWLEGLRTVASGSACLPASAAFTSFATRSASQWQQPPSCSLTWCTSTRAWDSAWEPWCVAGIREAQVRIPARTPPEHLHMHSQMLLLKVVKC